MKKIFFAFALLVTLSAQSQLYTTPSGGNKRATVSEGIGITNVIVNYSRPAVKGREGKIWGQLVPEGFTDQGFGPSKAAPWRAGANENTTIEFSTDVMVEGKALAAGKYGFFIAYGKDECTLIFSKDNEYWGSFYYKPQNDALRVNVKPIANTQNVEWLKYEFTNQTETSATVNLCWEKLCIPFTVKVDLNKTQIASFRKELRAEKSYIGWQPWHQAAQWCFDHDTNLEEALLWADTSVNPNVLGEKNFATLSTRAGILEKLNRSAEAEASMHEAMAYANMGQIHQYARQLLTQKKTQKALEMFKLNYDRNPNQFTTLFGLARGYSAVGDYKKALEYAEKALPVAPDGVNKTNVEKCIALLKQGKDIN